MSAKNNQTQDNLNKVETSVFTDVSTVFDGDLNSLFSRTDLLLTPAIEGVILKPVEDVYQDVDTNIFETKTGVLNLAPIKISGQYKIVVTENNELYLDDYNNKRVLINKSQKFLPQLANFLRIKSTISDYTKLRYGGFSKSTQLSYHAPIYIGKDNLIPDYFIINNK